MTRILAMIFLVTLAACAGGNPLPAPIGPWEPLNGWTPEIPTEVAGIPR